MGSSWLVMRGLTARKEECWEQPGDRGADVKVGRGGDKGVKSARADCGWERGNGGCEGEGGKEEDSGGSTGELGHASGGA